MHNNYFFLRKLSETLNERLTGALVSTIFTQNKDELVLSFDQKDVCFHIKALLSPSFSCLSFPPEIQRAKKNSVDLFDELVGKKVVAIRQIQYDRSFVIEMSDGYLLLFKLYGTRSNIILFHREKFLKMFRNNLGSDRLISIAHLKGHGQFSFETFSAHDGDFRKLSPVFGKDFDVYFAERDYDNSSTAAKWGLFQALLSYLQEPVFCISSKNGLPVFRIYKDHHTMEIYKDPLDALDHFFALYTREFQLVNTKKQLIAQTESSIQKGMNYIAKAEGKLISMHREQPFQQIGDILMANLHVVPKYAETVVLYDFYNNKDVNIKLNSRLSAQENAARYYRKSKNQSIEIETVQQNIAMRKKELAVKRSELRTIIEANDLKTLKQYLKTLQKAGDPSKKALNDVFHTYLLQGYEILAGKNDRTNDQLTFTMAHKNDLWLHVKDSPGSHVIVRHKPGENFPKPVIEYAASIAAFHSKRKNEALCPVTYTARKYVRKRKGLKSGEVVVDREQVIIVPPLGTT